MLKNNINALTFDTGGTILDWHSGFKNGFEKLKTNKKRKYVSSNMANLMRKKSLFKVTNQENNNLLNFDYAHKMAVEEIDKEYDLKLSQKEKKYLSVTIPSKLKAWKDFKKPYDVLRNKYLCVSFTLLSNRLVFKNSKFNKIDWDLILSCETLEIYKPNIKAYIKTAKLLQLDPSQCAMVACHSFDLNAAKSAGFKTIFIKRTSEWGNNTQISVDGNYDLVLEGFNELKEALT